LLSYLIVSDKQIHSNEMDILKDYWQKNEFSEEEKNLCQNILEDKEEKIPLDKLIADIGKLNFNEEEKQQFITNLCELAICDMHKHDLEEKIIEEIAKQLHFQGAKNILQVAYDKAKKELKRKINRGVFKNKEFGQAIRSGAEIAKNDMEFITNIIEENSKAAEECLETAKKLLKTTVKNTDSEEARELEENISDFIDLLEESVMHSVKENKEILNRKQRAMNYFTISFLGKTKAGKSTLHTVMTDKGKAFIGSGSQRTTRFNRVYERDNIRIIDTPGIGAAEAGGRKDEEIAKSVIDETDVLCYIVTNDNVLKTDFNFMAKIKAKNKPIVILLNVKENIATPDTALNRFIQDPHYWKVRKDNKNIQGHINHLKEYISELKNFTIDFEKEIIPVHLLAAFLSKEKKHRAYKDELYEGSHLDDFLGYVKKSIIESITLRRSQTIIDGTVYYINNNLGDIESFHTTFADIAKKVKEKKEGLLEKIEDDKTKVIKNCLQGIDTLFETFLMEINFFVNTHYELKKDQLEKEWDSYAESTMRVENRIHEVIQKNIELEQKDIQDYISDLAADMDSFIRYQSIELKALDLFDTKRVLSIIGTALSAAGSIVLFGTSATVTVATTVAAVAGPIGWGLITVGGVIVLLSNVLKNKKTKKQGAIKELTGSLQESMETYKAKVVEQIPKMIEEALDKTASGAGGILSQIQSGAEVIEKSSLFLLNKYKQWFDETNKYFARRICDFCSGSIKPKLEPGDYSGIKVTRNYGREITIQTNIDCSKEKIKKAIKILQENISIPKPNKEAS